MKHIAIEGNIGAGKTTLTRMLLNSLPARAMLEPFDENPLLPLFYADPSKHALSLEISFMAQRFLQWSRWTTQTDLFYPFLVSDYHCDKSKLFAALNLDEDTFAVFDRLYQGMRKHLVPPEVLIYVHRPLEVLEKNIALRARPYEQGMPMDYLRRIEQAYSDWLPQCGAQAVLRWELNEKKMEDLAEQYARILDFVRAPWNSFVILS